MQIYRGSKGVVEFLIWVLILYQCGLAQLSERGNQYTLYKAAGWYLDGGNAIIMIGKLDGASDDYEAAKHANLIAGLVQGL